MSIEKAIHDQLRKIGNDIAEEIRTRDFSDTGASQEFEINVDGNKVQLIGMHHIGALIHGRRPGKFPPVDVIREYVERNDITMNIDGKDLTPDQVAYMIGKGIAEKGTRIYRGEIEGVDIERIIENNEKELYDKIADEAVKEAKILLKI